MGVLGARPLVVGVSIQAECAHLRPGASLDLCGPAVHLYHHRAAPAHAALVVGHAGAASGRAGRRAARRHNRRDLAPVPIRDGLVELWDRLFLHALAAAVCWAGVSAAEDDARGVWSADVMHAEDIQLLYDYNCWANARIMRAAAGVPDEQFASARLGYCGLRDTLVHMFSAERRWRARWQGQPNMLMLVAEQVPALDVLRELWEAEPPLMRAYLATV